jgi:hypothetical protein
MRIGLLWFDNDPQRGLAAKIAEAARHYNEKFGSSPDTCYVNQTQLTSQGQAVALAGDFSATLRVVPSQSILPHHFWVGVENG